MIFEKGQRVKIQKNKTGKGQPEPPEQTGTVLEFHHKTKYLVILFDGATAPEKIKTNNYTIAILINFKAVRAAIGEKFGKWFKFLRGIFRKRN